MKKKILLLTVTVLLCACFILTGCGNDNARNDGTSSDGTAADQTETAGEDKKNALDWITSENFVLVERYLTSGCAISVCVNNKETYCPTVEKAEEVLNEVPEGIEFQLARSSDISDEEYQTVKDMITRHGFVYTDMEEQ